MCSLGILIERSKDRPISDRPVIHQLAWAIGFIIQPRLSRQGWVPGYSTVCTKLPVHLFGDSSIHRMCSAIVPHSQPQVGFQFCYFRRGDLGDSVGKTAELKSENCDYAPYYGRGPIFLSRPLASLTLQFACGGFWPWLHNKRIYSP